MDLVSLDLRQAATIRFLRAMMKSPFFQVSIFLLSAIVLVHFEIPKTALAVLGPPGPDRRLSTPVECDYPDDDALRSAFTGSGPDETVVWADVHVYKAPLDEFCSRYDKKWFVDCYPNGYLNGIGLSDRWRTDFYYRFTVVFLRAARGWVYLLSRADGPRESFPGCGFWYQVQFPILRANEAVSGIVVVNADDYEDQWLYWLRGDGDQARRRPSRGDDNVNGEDSTEGNGNGNGGYGPMFNALTGALTTGTGLVGAGLTQLQTGAAGLFTAGLEAWRAFRGGKKHLSTPAGDPNQRKDQPDPGTKTDVLDLKIGELPDFSDGIDEKWTPTALDPLPAANDFEANVDTSREGDLGIGGVLNADNNFGDFNAATSLNLFGRGRRIRSLPVPGTCNSDWAADPSSLSIPGRGDMLQRLETAASQSSTYWLLYPFAPGQLATLLITQYEKGLDSQRQSVDYHLDVNILNADGKPGFTQQKIDAPSGQETTIEADLPLPLYVQVADQKDSPIIFRYGTPLAMDTVSGVRWDSNDQSPDHRCTTDPTGLWEDKRQIMCLFKL